MMKTSPAQSNACEDGARCRFLDLPGELRNRIYDCLLGEACHKSNEVLRLQRVATKQTWEAICSTLPPGFLSLTQVCRQIRSEILPQYRDCLSRTTVSLKSNDIYDYINARVMTSDTKKEDIVGSLVLDLGRSYDDNDWVILDIRPLLQLSKQAPGLRLGINDLDDSRYVRQSPRHASIENTLVNLLAIVDTEKFYNYVETATTKLVWHDSRGAPALVFEMKPNCWEEWMAEKTCGDELDWAFSAEREADAINWARRCGLAFMEDDANVLLCHPENVVFRREGQAEVQDGLRSRTYHRRTRTKSPERL